ncbi:hypothetical protein GJV85_07470 [Sulfurimonas aquatica]|uniref:Type II secretion system F family protein n=1 Tax=Sulfurimonas aquatica TaxID=2672570 RepID=A0A975B0H5_9BACT|nr:type II secretion system F family protein [Sulfurimonas aquatica]QSZ41952.1 hypothetical protein GJV85_07470 [Sulfurimonas aquatica]
MITFATLLMILSFLVMSGLLGWYFFIGYKHKSWLNKVFYMNDAALLEQSESTKKAEFKLKLLQAGLKRSNFNEVVLAGVVAGFALASLTLILDLKPMINFMIIFISLAIATLTPFLYLDEQRKARIKRIENDLAIFLDLLIIILEGGGGLNNAIDVVTVEGKSVIGNDLLAESERFKYEFITYSSEIAYENLSQRTGSPAVKTIVGFMKLSEETGIGVKSIFENQAQEIKDMDMLNVEKRAATMNISLTFTMFIFILPAVIAMIAFPMAADALMPKF